MGGDGNQSVVVVIRTTEGGTRSRVMATHMLVIIFRRSCKWCSEVYQDGTSGCVCACACGGGGTSTLPLSAAWSGGGGGDAGGQVNLVDFKAQRARGFRTFRISRQRTAL